MEEIKKKIEVHKQSQPPKVAKVMSVREQDKTGDWHIHLRGDIRNLGPVVERGFLQSCQCQKGFHQLGKIPNGASGRLN